MINKNLSSRKKKLLLKQLNQIFVKIINKLKLLINIKNAVTILIYNNVTIIVVKIYKLKFINKKINNQTLITTKMIIIINKINNNIIR